MNRKTRDKFASGTNRLDLTSGNACWETPPAIFAKLNQQFGPFDVDLTADARRHLCPVWFGPDSPVSDDALSYDWHSSGRRRGYSNPPYGPFVQKILAKAKHEAKEHGFVSVLLLPMRATKAFHAHILNGATSLLFCDKRITFWENGAPRINPRTGKPDGALFDSIVVIYGPFVPTQPDVWSWQVPPHVASAPPSVVAVDPVAATQHELTTRV